MNYKQVSHVIAYNASAIYYGDSVELSCAGTVVRSDGTSDPAGIVGIFVGCKYPSVVQERTVLSKDWLGRDVASSQTVEGFIVTDPRILTRYRAGIESWPCRRS